MTWAPPEPLYAVFLFYGLLVCIHHCQSKGDDGSGDGDQKKKISGGSAGSVWTDQTAVFSWTPPILTALTTA